MHPIDEAILRGRLTTALLKEHAALPLPAETHSYWGDAMRYCCANHLTPGEDAWLEVAMAAARLAARQMGQTLESIDAITRN